MHDSIEAPNCFASSVIKTAGEDPPSIFRIGASVLITTYQTKIAGQYCLITITWCKSLLLHGLAISVQGLDGGVHYQCKVELKPWNFWKTQGNKHFKVDQKKANIVWDLKAAKFNGETEPQSDFYVAVVCGGEVVLVVGDQKKEAFRRTGCRPALIDPMVVSRREHVFGKKKFCTRAKFEDKGHFHSLSIECSHGNSWNNSSVGVDPEMEIKIDGTLAVHVKHLQWKFRGNQSIYISKTKFEVYWDVHDWLFHSGPRHGLFIFRPASSCSTPTSTSPPPLTSSPVSTPSPTSGIDEDGESFTHCLYLYVWKID